MDPREIIQVLQKSGFHRLGLDGSDIVMEDPSCILRSFVTFTEYAWVIITAITGFLLLGWSISLIRGAKTDLMTNMRNLLIIFATLGIAAPIINTVYGDKLFEHGCRIIRIPIAQVQTMLDARNAKLKSYNPDDLYENIDIYDSGAILRDTPYADAPLYGAGDPVIVDPESYGYSEYFQGNESTRQNYAYNPSSGQYNTYGTSSRASDNRPAGPGISAHKIPNERTVIYTNADGVRYRLVGGTPAWRNNNPGNIRYSAFSRRMGAIGNADGFAVFPDEATGRRAITALMKTDTYQHLTIAGAISRYAPPSENNTAGYHKKIQELTGLSINRRIRDLSDAELGRVTNAIERVEGWRPGQIIIM